MNKSIVQLINSHKIKFAHKNEMTPYNLANSFGTFNGSTDKIFINTPLILENKYSIESVMLHELLHWTGNTNRLNRRFFEVAEKSKVYPNKIIEAEEELVAQLGTLELAKIYNLDVDRYTRIFNHYSSIYNIAGVDRKYIIQSTKEALNYLLGR